MHALVETSDSSFFKYWDKLCAGDSAQQSVRSQDCDSQHPGKQLSVFTDRSFLVMAAEEPIFGCSLTMHLDERGRKCIGYFGREASCHFNKSTMDAEGHGFRPETIQLLQEHVNDLLEEIQPHTVDYLDPVSCGLMSPVTQVLLEKGATPRVRKSQIIDLTLSERELFQGMTKSCRGMVAWGNRNLDIEIIDGDCFEASLHGRNRVGPSGDGQRYETLLSQGKGFLVVGRYKGDLVSSSLFVQDNGTCRHLSCEYLSSPIDRPVFHRLFWEAILHAKTLHCAHFDFGSARINTSNEQPSSETGFSATCFGGESCSRLLVTLDRKSL